MFFCLLDNTFFGTLLAGGLLAWLGLWLYRRQKQIDAVYENHKKLKEKTSMLFAIIEVAGKDFRGQIGMLDGQNQQLKSVYDALNAKYNNHFNDEFEKKFNQYVKEIDQASNNLVTHLKLYGGELYKQEADVLTENMAKLNMYLLGASVMRRFNANELENLKKGFEETYSLISGVLQKILKQNL